jgi:hypothetical protein
MALHGAKEEQKEHWEITPLLETTFIQLSQVRRFIADILSPIPLYSSIHRHRGIVNPSKGAILGTL